MNPLDRSIADNLRISRSGYAWGWMHYAQACDAVLMAELARNPGDARARAYPHQVAPGPIPATMPVPEWLHDLVREVTDLRRAHSPDTTHEQTLRMALHAGLQRERSTLELVRERLS